MNRLPICTVHHFAEEDVTVQTPRVLKHLSPLARRIDSSCQACKINRLIYRSSVGCGTRNAPRTIAMKSHAWAIYRKTEVVEAVHYDAVFQAGEIQFV